ncbi:MAG: isoleucine--tRNA ligase [Bacteroidota bacterium]
MPFKELTEKISYPDLESEILRFWKEHGVFERSISLREGCPGFTFYEGPPTANGRPGIHHVMSRTLKDLVCRYKTMRGFQVHRKAGWDTHGLPVEIEVEKELGFRTKDDVLRFGVAEFNRQCRASVWKYKQEWESMTERMGYWVDLSRPYVTFENDYIESVWWALKRFYEEGLIYRGHKIQPYCPRCETPLSSHEVSLGYEDVKDPSIYVRMRLLDRPGVSFLVWTTTPWTLVSNVALAVHPDVDYVTVLHRGERLILARDRLAALDGEYTVEACVKGGALAGAAYERLFDYHPVGENAFRVITAGFVTTEDGSGIVHLAPAYGEDDYQAARAEGLPTIHPVDRSGKFGPEVTDFAGRFVKDADPLIIQNLKARGLLYRKETVTHSYPHCWRCKTPLLYYARASWYIATTRYARRMIDLNRRINWVPPEVGEGRFGNWLEENKDWALSRDRFWGTPLPLWICDACGAVRCVGSIRELREGSGVPDPLDLHKPSVDAVTFACSCGGVQRRVPELIDVWFDSGAMPFAQWHYPFENRHLVDGGARHPADFICEGIDQTRGWFYSLHAISTFLFDRPAFRNILVNELVLDRDGQKMSKSRGNTVHPSDILARYGADAVRWYLVTASPPWRPTMFDAEGPGEVQRRFFGTLVNTYAFFALYANIDGFAYREPRIPVAERPEIDRWIISELNSLLERYTSAMDAYDVTRAARGVSEFTVDLLSNWYVRRNRRRFWKSSPGRDKTAAYQTLYECLAAVAKLAAPFAPFLAEELYGCLNRGTGLEESASVHWSLLPGPESSAVDRDLERRMERARRIVTLVRSMRMQAGLKVRQPLGRIILPAASLGEQEALRRMEDVIMEEVNVKAVQWVEDDAGLVRKSARPRFKSVGPRFGPKAKMVAERIRGLEGPQIGTLERTGFLEVSLGEERVTLTSEDVEILREDMPGWLVESDGDLTVALDTALDEALRAEGAAREFVNRIQNLRKEAGFRVTDRIAIRYAAPERLGAALRAMASYIASETLALTLTEGLPAAGGAVALEVNGETVEVAIERLACEENNR